MAPTSPTVASWELSIRIRDRRKELGMDAQSVAKALGFSRNYWSAVENDRAILAEDKFEALLELFEWKDPLRAELRTLWTSGREKGWWNEPKYGLEQDDLIRFYGLEYGARKERNFGALVVPGLLQTQDYFTAMASADPGVSTVDIKRLATIRLKRQERLSSDSDFHLTSLISEAALRQFPTTRDGGKILTGQLQDLLNKIDQFRDRLTVRIVPFNHGLGGLMAVSAFTLLSFESKHLPEIGWQDSGRVLGFVDEKSRSHLEVSYDETIQESLAREASIETIERCIQAVS